MGTVPVFRGYCSCCDCRQTIPHTPHSMAQHSFDDLSPSGHPCYDLHLHRCRHLEQPTPEAHWRGLLPSGEVLHPHLYCDIQPSLSESSGLPSGGRLMRFDRCGVCGQRGPGDADQQPVVAEHFLRGAGQRVGSPQRDFYKARGQTGERKLPRDLPHQQHQQHSAPVPAGDQHGAASVHNEFQLLHRPGHVAAAGRDRGAKPLGGVGQH